MAIHIQAKDGDIAEKVLLPGDPLRAKHIAETFLENAVCYNTIRGMLGYTGSYRGERISVQGTGMGMPSMSIYANELIQYGVRTMIRVGTCASLLESLQLRDLVIAQAACTDSGMNRDRFGSLSFAPIADFSLLRKAAEAAEKRGLRAVVGNVFTSDQFYDDRLAEKNRIMANHGVLAVDMETAELYVLAAKHGRKALTVMTVSDSFVTGEKCSGEERQLSFNSMIELALAIL